MVKAIFLSFIFYPSYWIICCQKKKTFSNILFIYLQESQVHLSAVLNLIPKAQNRCCFVQFGLSFQVRFFCSSSGHTHSSSSSVSVSVPLHSSLARTFDSFQWRPSSAQPAAFPSARSAQYGTPLIPASSRTLSSTSPRSSPSTLIPPTHS